MSFVIEMKVIDITKFFKHITYSQLFLMQKANKILTREPKKEEDKEFEKAMDGTGDDYMNYLNRNLF